MNENPVAVIKETKSKTRELVLTTVLIACGVNLIIFGICYFIPNDYTYISIIIGGILVAFSIFYIFFNSFMQSCRKRIINASILYDKQSRLMVKIPNYNFSEDICKCLTAAISEDPNIKAMWFQDELGLTDIFNNVSPNKTYIAVSRSGAVLNQLIEYLMLRKLAVLTTDYFNSPNFNKRKIKTLKRIDVSDLIASNCFLNLFSKPTYERVAFDNKTSNMVYGYGNGGAIYDKFELTLPDRCEVSRGNLNTIIIKHPYFKLTITPAFTGFGNTIPMRFLKNYLKVKEVDVIASFKVWIGICLEFNWRAFFMNKVEYYNWIDRYISSIFQYASSQHFFDRIQWDIIEAMIQVQEKN